MYPITIFNEHNKVKLLKFQECTFKLSKNAGENLA